MNYIPRDHFDISPQQYHAGLDELWAALGVTGVQEQGVFTLAAREIERLKKEEAQGWRESSYHENQRAERLAAINADLLEACKVSVAGITGGSIYPAHLRPGNEIPLKMAEPRRCFVLGVLVAAIAKAEGRAPSGALGGAGSENVPDATPDS